MIMATGPTGSGKTTTLYSIIAEINSADVNIITIEDPIEYAIPGINRGNVSENLIEETAVNSGMKTLKIDGLEKAKKGLTSLEEVMKAVLLGG